jgi:CHAD domain-containing protein
VSTDRGTTRFTVAADSDTATVLERLGDAFDIEVEPDTSRRTVLLDTFDWRIWNDGGVLELHPTPRPRRTRSSPSRSRPAGRGRSERSDATPPPGGTLVWRSRDTGAPRAELTVDHEPRLVDDVGDAPTRDQLARVLEMRALRPLVTLRTTTTVARILDDERKTVARLVLERTRRDRGPALPAVIEIRPVRGYNRAARSLIRWLAKQDGLTPGASDPIEEALRAAGFAPGSYSSKLLLALNPDAEATHAWAEVLATLAETLDANEPGARDDLDSEFLHDFRVAVRRTRSVLAQGRGVLAPAPLTRFRDDFAWLGTVTSPTRDLDVWLLTLPELAAGIDETLRDELEPLRALLERHQRTAQRRLVRDLDSPRYARLRRDYAAWLAQLATDEDTEADGGTDLPDARRGAPAVAGARIAKAYKRVVRDGRRIDDDSPPESLHELRKDAKRLRYALECFGSLFPSEPVQALVRDLKGLQDCLGEFQDCEVQAGTLRGYADDLARSRAGAGTLLAMGALVEQLAERQHRARAAFHARFVRFDTPANGTIVRTVFAHATAGDRGAAS